MSTQRSSEDIDRLCQWSKDEAKTVYLPVKDKFFNAVIDTLPAVKREAIAEACVAINNTVHEAVSDKLDQLLAMDDSAVPAKTKGRKKGRPNGLPIGVNPLFDAAVHMMPEIRKVAMQAGAEAIQPVITRGVEAYLKELG